MSENNLLKQYKAERDSDLEKRRKLLTTMSEEEICKTSALQWKNALEYVEKNYPGISIFEYEVILYKSKFNFSAVQDFLKEHSNTAEKLKFLFEIKAEFEQKSKNEFLWLKNQLGESFFHFGENCQIEIEKLEKLLRLEERQTESKDGIKKHKDITLDRATLFINYLLDFAKEKSRENYGLKNKKQLTDADKDRIIDFLTPFAGTQSKKLHKRFKDEAAKIAEKEEVSEKFYKDMQVIRKYFEMLGLSEIINKIDADLGEK